jgi:hypothetical protein
MSGQKVNIAGYKKAFGKRASDDFRYCGMDFIKLGCQTHNHSSINPCRQNVSTRYDLIFIQQRVCGMIIALIAVLVARKTKI